MTHRDSFREFVLMVLFAAFCTAVALVCFCIGQDRAAAEAEARHKRAEQRWRATGATVLMPPYRGLMLHIEPIDSEVKP